MRLTFHKKDSLEKIKEATITLLSECGYNSITMRKIAKEAEVGLGQVTYYYHTKENLICSVIKELMDVFYNELEKNIEKADNKEEALLNFFSNVVNEDKTVTKLFFVITCESMNNKKIKEIFLEFTKKIVNCIESVCEDTKSNLSGEQKEKMIRDTLSSLLFTSFEKIMGLDKLYKPALREKNYNYE